MIKKVLPNIAKGLVAVGLLAAAVLPVTSVFATGSSDPETLVISGSSTVGPIVQLAVTRFPAAPIDGDASAVLQVTVSDSGTGRSDLMKGFVDDIAMSSSACSNVSGATYTCADVTSTPIARDAVTIVVNKNAPCTISPSLTKTQVQNIWFKLTADGGYTNWNQLPGCNVNHQLDIYAREVGSGTRQSLSDMNGKLDDSNKIAASGTRVNQNSGMETAIDNDIYGIGYVGLHFTDANLVTVALSSSSYGGSASPDAVYPSDDTVQNNTYPMSRLLYLMTLDAVNTKPLIQTFIQWMLSPDGQSIVQLEGYLPIGTVWNAADVNLDGTINTGDVVGIGNANYWNKSYTSGGNPVPYAVRADCSGDGTVNTGDVVQVGLSSNWGKASH